MPSRGPRPHGMKLEGVTGVRIDMLDGVDEECEESTGSGKNPNSRVTVSVTFRADVPAAWIAHQVMGMVNAQMGYDLDSINWTTWETDGDENDAG